jgi:phosphoribosylglycinamide formyltransferase-1
MNKMKLALFASGNGSNAIAIIRHFQNHPSIQVEFLLSNNADAPIAAKANALGIKVITLTNHEAANDVILLNLLEENQINYVVLAGYLRQIPAELTKVFSDRIINIHPSLLPKHGGKGMYGKFVHEKVISENDSESGITIHFVNENFDDGRYIAQFYCAVDTEDTAETLQKKINKLELDYFPLVIEKVVSL